MALRPAGLGGKNLDAVDENAAVMRILARRHSMQLRLPWPAQHPHSGKRMQRALVAKVRMRRKTTKGFDRGPTLD